LDYKYTLKNNEGREGKKKSWLGVGTNGHKERMNEGVYGILYPYMKIGE
jgi:hypothetical protein